MLSFNFDVILNQATLYVISNKLKPIQCYREEGGMKKYLAVRSKDEIKSISKTTTDKHELRRLHVFYTFNRLTSKKIIDKGI